MDWRAKVELFEQIRLEYEFGVGTIQGVARKLRVHRRVVREAIQSAIPARRKKTERPHVKMAPAAEFIDAILEADRKARGSSATRRNASGIVFAKRCRDYGGRAHGTALCGAA